MEQNYAEMIDRLADANDGAPSAQLEEFRALAHGMVAELAADKQLLGNVMERSCAESRRRAAEILELRRQCESLAELQIEACAACGVQSRGDQSAQAVDLHELSSRHPQLAMALQDVSTLPAVQLRTQAAAASASLGEGSRSDDEMDGGGSVCKEGHRSFDEAVASNLAHYHNTLSRADFGRDKSKAASASAVAAAAAAAAATADAVNAAVAARSALGVAAQDAQGTADVHDKFDAARNVAFHLQGAIDQWSAASADEVLVRESLAASFHTHGLYSASPRHDEPRASKRRQTAPHHTRPD